MMNSDQLRALADALRPMAKAPCFDGIDIERAADYLRAQAEPCIGNDPTCPCQDGDACHYRDAADGTKGWPVPQAEPKREPSLGELMREQRQSRIVAGAYPDGNPNAGAMMAQTRQAEPKPTPASGDDLSVYKEMADSYRNDEPTGAPYGIIDPDYGRVYTIARKLAWEEGYAIGLHGSFTRDLDLIAVPWAERACEPEHLIRRIVDATGLKLRDGVGVKPHGRRAWTLLFPAFGDPRFVDLSVMPRIGGSDAE